MLAYIVVMAKKKIKANTLITKTIATSKRLYVIVITIVYCETAFIKMSMLT